MSNINQFKRFDLAWIENYFVRDDLVNILY